jgi:hypothetical protein
MAMTIRSSILAVGAAAFLSSQAVYAAPARSGPALDPLVSLSILGSEQSRTAFCGGGACTASSLTPSASFSPAVAGMAASSAAVQEPGYQQPHPDWLGIGVLFFVPLFIAIAILAQGGDNGDPVSPF